MSEKLAIPYALSIKGLIEVISGWNRLIQNGKPVTKDELARVCKVGTGGIRKQNPFLTQIGIIRKKEKGFLLTTQGAQITKMLDLGKTDKFKDATWSLVRKWSQISPVLEYLEGLGETPRESFIERIILLSGRSRDNKDTKSGAGALADLLLMVEIIKEHDGMIVLSNDYMKDVESIKVRTELTIQEAETDIEVKIGISVKTQGSSGREIIDRFVQRLADIFENLEIVDSKN